MKLASVSLPLRYFYEVAKSGSFRRAGDRLNVAASAVNRQVTMLEAELKVKLFERRPGRGQLRLTSAGEILIHRVSQSMNELEVATQAIDGLKGLRRGNVTIGVNDSLARDFLPGVLLAFHGKYPGINFTVIVENTPKLIDLADRDELDVLMAYNVPPRNNLRVIESFPLGMCVLVSVDHPLAGYEELRLSDCLDYPWALPDASMFLSGIQQQLIASRAIEPRALLRTNAFELIREMVGKGIVISIQTQFLLKDSASSTPVVSIPLRDKFPVQHSLAFCVRRGASIPFATEAFLEVTQSELRLALREKK